LTVEKSHDAFYRDHPDYASDRILVKGSLLHRRRLDGDSRVWCRMGAVHDAKWQRVDLWYPMLIDTVLSQHAIHPDQGPTSLASIRLLEHVGSSHELGIGYRCGPVEFRGICHNLMTMQLNHSAAKGVFTPAESCRIPRQISADNLLLARDCPLFLAMLDQLLLDSQALLLAHVIHVLPGNIGSIPLPARAASVRAASVRGVYHDKAGSRSKTNRPSTGLQQDVVAVGGKHNTH